jgi:prevent-host-death family protein
VIQVQIGELRNRASAYIRQVEAGETILVLNRGRPVAKLVPLRPEGAPKGLLGVLRGTAEIEGDIEACIAPPGAWFED